MKARLHGLIILLLTFSVGSAVAGNEPVANSDLPKRAPGMWRITTISPEIGMQSNEICIEDGDSVIGPRAHDCTPPSVSRAEDQVIVTIECGTGEQREIGSLLFTGDFRTWYRAQSRTTSGARRSGYTIDAKFLKPICTIPDRQK
jgi:hypothetical protein